MAINVLQTGSVGPQQNPTLTLTGAVAGETILVFITGPVTITLDAANSTTGWVQDYYKINSTGFAIYRLPAADNLGGDLTLKVFTNGSRNLAYVAVTSPTIGAPQYGVFGDKAYSWNQERGVVSGNLMGTDLHTFPQEPHVFAVFPLVNIDPTNDDMDVVSYDRSFTELADSGITTADPNEESRLWIAYKADTAMSNDGVTATLGETNIGNVRGWHGMVAYDNALTNQPPVVDAGANKLININESTTLTVVASDADGTITDYLWEALDGGPAPDTPTATSTNVGPFATPGLYGYKISVTDDGGATGTDTVNVIVTDPNNTEEGIYDSITLTSGGPPATETQDLNLFTQFFVANPVTLSGFKYFRPAGATGTYTLSIWKQDGTPITNITDNTSTPDSWVSLPTTEILLESGWYVVGEHVPAGQPFVTFTNGHPDNVSTTSISGSLWCNTGGNDVPVSSHPVVYNLGGSGASFINYGTLEAVINWTYGVSPIVKPQNDWVKPIFYTAKPSGQFDDSGSLTLGQWFTPINDSTLKGVFYWRSMVAGATNDTVTVAVYNSIGTLLQQKTNSQPSVMGWNRIDFDSSVGLSGGTSYVIAFYTPNGMYAATNGALGATVDGTQYDLLNSGGKYSTASSLAYPTTDAGNNSYYYVEPAFLKTTSDIPSVDAGANQSSAVGLTATLTGTASDDGTVIDYAWSQVSGPTLAPNSLDTPTTTVGPFVTAGTYVYRLTVTDNDGYSSSDIVTITVLAEGAPITYRAFTDIEGPSPTEFFTYQGTLNLGLWFTVQEPDQVLYRFWCYYQANMGTLKWTLYSASGVALATATLTASAVSGWRAIEVDGGPYSLTNGATYRVAFKGQPDAGNFYSTVGYYPTNKPGDYDAGPFRLGGIAQDPNSSPNTYNTSSMEIAPNTQALGGRNYWIDVEVGALAAGQVQAQAGNDQTVLAGSTVTLDGGGSAGTGLTFDWHQNSGTSVTLSGSGATRTFTAPSSGPLEFGLIVTDGDGNVSEEDTMLVSVANNKVAVENANSGTATAAWYGFTGVGDRDVLGYAYPFNPSVGSTVQFRIDGSADELKIYRLGWYGGMGARLIETLAVTPTNQPSAINIPDLQGGSSAYEASNWTTNATWNIPGDVTSGLFLGICRNTTTGKKSFLRFVVTDHARASDMVVSTSDATWQAYNFYGPGTTDGGCVYGPDRNFAITNRAFGWSYLRPIIHREARVNDLFNSEVAMIRFLERNGYDVKYVSHLDLDAQQGLDNSQIYMSSGHDEYWSEPARNYANAHIASGKNAIFSSGNEVFWRTERHPSNPNWFYCRKDTMPGPGAHVHGTQIGSSWTGTWRDTRWPERQPEHEITGTRFRMNGIFDMTFTVDGAVYGSSPFWRDTSVASGGTLSINGLIGFEADEYAPGTNTSGVRLSATVHAISGAYADDNGEDYGGSNILDHGLSLTQRYGQGVVLGMGTCQWAWGLDDFHDRGPAVANIAIQQATANILSDMGAQPDTIAGGLVYPSPVAWSDYGLNPILPVGIYTADTTKLTPYIKKADGSIVSIDFKIK